MSDEAKIILKDMQIEEMRKEIISQDQFIAQLEKEYVKEIERLNNVIDKKEQFLGDNIKRLEREVVKRDNVINELEKYLIEQVEKSYSNDYDNVLDKLDELKGDYK